jgi:hypothetical protein
MWFMLGFRGLALVLLCILPMYLGAPYTFIERRGGGRTFCE